MEQVKKQPLDSVLFAGTLALAGGFFDAYSYICRDGVFANAQTGNVVKLAMALAQSSYLRALRYLIPILAFILGIFIALKIKSRSQTSNQNAASQALLVESLLLVVVALIPVSPVLNIIANVLISLICAVQTETFRKISGKPYASTMCTGNLRSMSENLYHFLHKKESESFLSFIQYFFLIMGFICGVITGVLLSQCFKSHAIAFMSILYLFLYFYLQKAASFDLKQVSSNPDGDFA